MLKIKNIYILLYSMLPWVRWKRRNGYQDLLKVALPLIASFVVTSVILFTDRLFLSNYSPEAIAAALPAGISKLTASAFFMGMLSYTSVFVAQYMGSRQHGRAVLVLWQSLFLSLILGALMTSLYFLAPKIFAMANHPPQIQAYEVIYFQILILFSVLEFLMVSMSAFLIGSGRTRIVMFVSLAMAVFNIPVDYFFIYGLEINGNILIPSMGVKGASIATACTWALAVIIYAFFIFNKKLNKEFNVLKYLGLDFSLIKRIIKYGAPSGLQFVMEIGAFTFFAFMVGRLGGLILTTNNIVFSIESLAFFPMLGVGQAVSVLMGRAIGMGKPSHGAESTKSGIGLCFMYLIIMISVFAIFPEKLLNLFINDTEYSLADRNFILTLGPHLLYFVIAYCAFDGFYLCCFGAIRGAGDVIFPMVLIGVAGLVVLVIPILVMVHFNWATIYTMWSCMVIYILCLNLFVTLRYKSGRWRKMKIIENVLSTNEFN